MAKKNMDILLGNILGDSTIIPQDKTDNPSEVVEENPKEEKCRKSVGKSNEPHWQHFSFICLKELSLIIRRSTAIWLLPTEPIADACKVV